MQPSQPILPTHKPEPLLEKSEYCKQKVYTFNISNTPKMERLWKKILQYSHIPKSYNAEIYEQYLSSLYMRSQSELLEHPPNKNIKLMHKQEMLKPMFYWDHYPEPGLMNLKKGRSIIRLSEFSDNRSKTMQRYAHKVFSEK